MASAEPETHFQPWRVFLIWNFLALIGFAVSLVYVTEFVSLGARMRITELDRVGAIDETKLREAYPALADNLRYNLGMWVAEEEREAARAAVSVSIAVAVVNLALMLLLWKPEALARQLPP